MMKCRHLEKAFFGVQQMKSLDISGNVKMDNQILEALFLYFFPAQTNISSIYATLNVMKFLNSTFFLQLLLNSDLPLEM